MYQAGRTRAARSSSRTRMPSRPHFAAIALLLLLVNAAPARPATSQPNLALHKRATASSVENDEHAAAQANDGDRSTSWRADDVPETGAEWWQVDLNKPYDLTACHIVWPYAGFRYRFKVEGSPDQKTWTMLAGETKSPSRTQVRRLTLDHATNIRYVRVTITAVDDGTWPSLS